MKEYKQQRSKENQQKTEEQIGKSNRKGQEGVSWEPYVIRSWNLKKQDIMI
jgi:hypothetical protein